MNKIQKSTHTHTQRKQKEELERVHERNLQNSRNLPRSFQFEYCGSSDNPSGFIERKESYTLPECANKPGYEGTFCME